MHTFQEFCAHLFGYPMKTSFSGLKCRLNYCGGGIVSKTKGSTSKITLEEIANEKVILHNVNIANIWKIISGTRPITNQH